ncbi:hypothetical protein SLEP1_g3947 [Rubroshorea leprosula]|uniref:Uncharacterized protein n=1 Tax=Rubroshorea leprosula TaxID=152421 RepID=A0AAV5HT57_9ROSI|nr:hypothetical protein SLEP1_g3947 [Rubroshorea leprosula]
MLNPFCMNKSNLTFEFYCLADENHRQKFERYKKVLSIVEVVIRCDKVLKLDLGELKVRYLMQKTKT